MQYEGKACIKAQKISQIIEMSF